MKINKVKYFVVFHKFVKKLLEKDKNNNKISKKEEIYGQKFKNN